jgi:hypothetical protein
MATPDNAQIQKALIVTDQIAAQGKLDPAQSDKFLDWVTDETGLKDSVRIVRFRNESMKIDKINVGRRVAVPKDEAADPGLRRGVSTSKIELAPKEIMVPFEISDRFAEVNLEGEAVKAHIVRMMAATFANNLEELYILGNKLGPAIIEADYRDAGSEVNHIRDNYLALVNGWSLLADGANVIDAEGENISAGIFSRAMRGLPTKFRRRMQDMRVLISPDLWSLYLERLASRATAVGDAVIGGGSHDPFGMKAAAIPLWPLNPISVEHKVLNGTTAVALKSANVTEVVVHPETLGNAATPSYVEGVDYTLDAAAGTVARIGPGAIADGATVKITYKAAPQIIMTHRDNLILAIGRDITLEKDRDIFKGMDQYALSAKVDVQIQNLDAVVKVKNIGTGV